MSESTPKYRLAVGAIFKNEGHCLKEWLEHYIYHGVEHFYLINDQSTDNYAEILQPYIEKGFITLNSPIWSRYMGRQHDMYNTYILPYLKTTDWLLMVDLDEFMWSHTSNDLHWVLSRIPNVGQIQVEHTLFGSNGHKKQPKSLVKGFTRRSAESPSQNPGLRKYFIKSSYEFSSLNLHHATFVNKEDEKNHFVVLNQPHFVLNHYNCQSESFWKDVKCMRGDADEYKVRDMELFKLNDQNDVEDTLLRDVNAGMVPVVPDKLPKYHVFIISVRESLIRRPHAVALKEKLIRKGVQTDILDAFYWKTCDVMKALADYGLTYTAPNNNVSLSAVGCFLSHYKLWKRIAAADPTERFIVLEDDMDIGPEFDLTELTETLPSQYDIVYLWKRPEQAAQQPSHIVAGEAYSTYYTQWGTNAYMITPSAAKYCLDTIKTLDLPVDYLLIKYIFNNIKSFIMVKDYFNQQEFKSILLGHDSADLEIVPQSSLNPDKPIALCLLCVTPNPIWLDFLKTFTQYTLYIMVDKQDLDLTDLKAKYPMIQFLQIAGNICKAFGYNDSNTAVYPAYVTIAWDKAIYYFSEQNTIHPYVWLVEEDVFFYNEQTLTDLDVKYPLSDLVISPTTDRSWDAKQPWDWHWCNIPFDDKLVSYENLFRGMVCGARMSNQMFKLCANYAQKNKQRKLMYIETLFPSLAKHHGLQIDTPDELKEITWNTKWVDKMPLTAGHLYHPMKDIGLHKTLRDAQNSKIESI